MAIVQFGIVGCGGDDANPESPSATPTSPSASATGGETTGGPPSGWEDDYSDVELRAFREALGRWKRYQQLAAPIDAAGKYTTEAEELYKEYVVAWQASASQLRDSEQAGIRIEEPPVALWATAESIELSKGESVDGALLVIRQCTDYSDVRVTKNGEDVSDSVKPESVTAPILIEMTNLGGKWKKLKMTVKDEPCVD